MRDRRTDPLKQWKVSPGDKVALKYWDEYSDARNEMLERTSSPLSPWVVVRADDMRRTRLNVIRDILSRIGCPESDKHHAVPDSNVVIVYDNKRAKAGLLAK